MRNISFALTTAQIVAGTKFVTRRMGWRHAKRGDLLMPVRQCMGLDRGQRVEALRPPIRIVDVSRESLSVLLDQRHYGIAECIREGFPELTPEQFIEFFVKSHRCSRDSIVTRIEFEYTT